MAGPMVLGIAAIKSVSMIDTLYIGQLGKDQLAALSFAFPVTTIILGLALGLSAGASSVISRALGEGQSDQARQLALHTLLLGTALTTLVSVLGAAVTGPLFNALGATDATLDYIVSYMRIWFIAVPFLTISMMSDFMMRAAGNSLWSSLMMTAGSLFNIAVTAALVFGLWIFPDLGIEGAAMGTLLAQILTAMIGLWLITAKAKLVQWALPKIRHVLRSGWLTAKVAIPAAFSNMVHPFTLTVITAILATFSQDIVAAFGVATQVEAIAVIPLLALSAGLSPIAGQSWGAGKVDRIGRALIQSYLICVVWSTLLAVALWFYGDDVARWFSDDSEIPDKAGLYLRIVPASFFGYGMVICASSVFNGIDQAKRALGFNILRSLCLFLPLAWVGARIADVSGVYAGISAANIVAGLAAGWYALHWLKCNADLASATESDES